MDVFGGIYRTQGFLYNKKGREWKTATMRRDRKVDLAYMDFGKAILGNWHGYSKLNALMNRTGSKGVLQM